jgi:hypothetical protein
MTLYDLNQICLNPIVVCTMCKDEKICIFTQVGRDKDLPELLEECIVKEIWCENSVVAVLI